VVECLVANENVASSSLVSRSAELKQPIPDGIGCFHTTEKDFIVSTQQTSPRALTTESILTESISAESVQVTTAPTKKSLRTLLAHHSPNTLKSAFVKHWAASNNVELKQIVKGETVRKVINLEDGSYDIKLQRQLHQDFPVLTLKEVEGIFEELLSIEHRKSFGAVYTPTYIIDYLVRNALRMCRPVAGVPQVCDPCCGSAGFLIRAADILADSYGFSASQAFSQALVGLDKDPLAIDHAHCVVELYLASRGVSLPFPDLRLFCTDSLTSTPEQLYALSGSLNGFDVVVTNPPYVKLQNLDDDYRLALGARFPQYAQGSFSLALLFLVAGHQILSPGGSLACITQNNLFTSLAGEQVRQYLQQEKCIRRIVDFGHHHVFDNASAYTCLVFLKQEPRDTFEYDIVEEKATSASLNAAEFSSIRHDALTSKKWRLSKPSHADTIRKIEHIGTPLGNMTSIRVGFATLKDSVFLVRQQDTRCIAIAPDHSQHEIEAELTRPVVKVADLASQSDLAHNTRRIIFPYLRSSGKYMPIPEDDLCEHYPKAYRYLLQCQKVLGERDKGKKDYNTWYAWGRTQGMEAPGPKLLTKTFSKRPQFMLDISDQLFCNGYAVFMQDRNSLFAEMPLMVLQRILNSMVMHYYAKMTSFQLEGNYQCYQKNFIGRFGIPDLDATQYDHLLSLEDHSVDEYVATLYGLRLDELTPVLYQS